MNKRLLIYIPVLFFLFVSANPGKEVNKDQVLFKVALAGLNSTHFQPSIVENEFSEKLFNLYLKRLDYGKRFFIKEDIELLGSWKNRLDDELLNGTTGFFDLVNELYDKRILQTEGFYKELLGNSFDYNVQETIETDPEKLIYAEDEYALKETWRKLLKFQALAKLNDLEQIQNKKIEARDSTLKKIKSFEELEKESREKVSKSISELFRRINQLERKDRIGIYINCISNIFDPHTEYFSPNEKENFDIGMSGQLEGIGAQLQEFEGNVKVSSIVPGSPSWKQGDLKAGDIILNVAQGEEEPVDVMDMRLDDVVKLVRGKKDTKVKLTVKKIDGTIRNITIIRDVVILEETYAKSAIIRDSNKDENIGYIFLPKFYADFTRNGGRSCAKDVAQELTRLKNENINRVILDLRNNGGGSLEDVVEMMGLFIPKGPIVQVKSKTGEPYILEDKNSSVLFSGPLVIMVNTFSASASEILAAAVQDYKRGVVVGSSTFGKGTVQRFFELDNYLTPEFSTFKPLGSMKVTTQKFYRIDGTTTQLKGVMPDIELPDVYSYMEVGEKELDYPLKWDIIQPAKYEYINSTNSVEKLRKNSRSRLNSNPSFQLISENIVRLKAEKDQTMQSLNIQTYKEEIKKDKEASKKFEENQQVINDLVVSSLKSDGTPDNSDTSKIARTKVWHTAMGKDAFLYESMQIVYELK